MASDARLLKASLRGDHEAFARIVQRYQSLVCAITYSGTGDLGASEDLAQEAFLAAWRRLGSLREPARLRAWLCTIARNLTADHLRRRPRDPIRDAVPLDEAGPLRSPAPTPAEHAITNEQKRLVWAALQDIPETYRVPLVLYYREQHSARRVAQALGISRSAVKHRLVRGRGMVKDKVASLVEDTLSTTAPGSTFAAAVLAGLAGTAVQKATGAGSTILGLSLAKATAVGVLIAGAAMGAVVALTSDAPEPAPLPAVAAVAAPEPAEPPSWPVYTAPLPGDLALLAEADFPGWLAGVRTLAARTGMDSGTPGDAEAVREVFHTDDASTVDLSRPFYMAGTESDYLRSPPFVFRLTDAERYVQSIAERFRPVEGQVDLYTNEVPGLPTFIGIVGNMAVTAREDPARATHLMQMVRQGEFPLEPRFPAHLIGYTMRAQPILAERDSPGNRDNPFNRLRERLGITRDYQAVGLHPLSGLVDGLEEVCLHQWDLFAAAVQIGDDDVSALCQFQPLDDTPLQRAAAEHPAGPVALLRHVPADSLAVLACKLPDLSSLVPAAGLPPGSLPGRALGLLGDEVALALGRSPEGTIRVLLALRVRDPAGARRLMDELAGLVGQMLQAGPPLRLSRSETLHNGHAIKVWDFDVVQPAGGAVAIGVSFALGKDLKLHEAIMDDALLLAFGDGTLAQVGQILDGRLAGMAGSERFAQAMTGMPETAPLVCCVEAEKLAGWVAELLAPAGLPALQGLEFGEGPPAVLLGHVIGRKVVELRLRLPFGAIATGVKWRQTLAPPRPVPGPAAAPPAQRFPDPHRAAVEGNRAEVERLLAEGADVNARLPGTGRSLLHLAVEQGRLEVVRLLLEKGADVNAEDERRRTPLHMAAERGHRAVVEALLEAGADVNATDLNGRTPAGLAVRAGHDELADLLREHGGVE